jgi:hypothetical protein
VGDSNIEGVELTPGQPRRLSGRVTAPEGRKVSPGLILVLGAREAGDTQGGGVAQVGADGAFTIPQVAPGEYDVVVVPQRAARTTPTSMRFAWAMRTH